MKHLLYKEFYLGRKYYITSLLIFFIISLMGVLIRLSIIYGNLANIATESSTNIDSITYEVFTYLPAVILFISTCTDGGVIFSDYNTKWAVFCYTTPISEKKLLGIKYLTKIITLSVSFVLGVINSAVIGTIANKPLNSSIMLDMLVLLTVAVTFSSLIIPSSVKFKSKNAVGILIFSILSVTAIPPTFILFNFIEKLNNTYSNLDEDSLNELMTRIITNKYIEIRNIIYPILPIIIIGVLAISFICSVKILKRREN